MLLYNESTSQYHHISARHTRTDYSHQTEKQVKAVEILNTNHAINTAIEKRKRKEKEKFWFSALMCVSGEKTGSFDGRIDTVMFYLTG